MLCSSGILLGSGTQVITTADAPDFSLMIRCQGRIALNAGCPKKLDVFDGWRSKVSKNTRQGEHAAVSPAV